MRLDRDSKQPIWLGLVLIFTAYIFTLFFITRVHASDLSAYDYNNVLLVQFSGATIEFCFADGSFGFRRNIGYEYTDGVPVITQDELENNLDGVFAYLLPSETIVLLFDNYAAAGPYLDTKSYFAQRGCAVLDYSGSFPFDVSGFSLSKINAGTWFIPFYTRSVPLTPTSSPTPTPVSETVSFQFYARPYTQSGSFSSIGYYLIDFVGWDFNKSVNVPSSNAYNYAYSNYAVSNPWINFVFFPYTSASSGALGCYFSGSVSSVRVYFYGSTKMDSSYVREHYTYTEFSFTGSDLSIGENIVLSYSSDLDLFFWGIAYSSDAFYLTGFYDIDVPMYKVSSSRISTTYLSVNNIFNQTSSFDSNYLTQAFRYGLSGDVSPTSMVTPTPEPTATPEPLPTSSESIHVILPTGTPTPTPPFSVSAVDPGGGFGSPGGSSQGSLTPGQVNSTLNIFKQYTQNNGAFAFLYACTGLIPDDALYFLFILLFILLLLACLRLFVHFTGG